VRFHFVEHLLQRVRRLVDLLAIVRDLLEGGVGEVDRQRIEILVGAFGAREHLHIVRGEPVRGGELEISVAREDRRGTVVEFTAVRSV